NAVISLMEDHFGEERFSFWELFGDEKRKILSQVSSEGGKLIETAFREFYNDGYQVMTAILLSGIPLPEAYQSAAQFVLNQDLRNFFGSARFHIRELTRLAGEFKKWGVALTDAPGIQLAASERIYREIQLLFEGGALHTERLHTLNQALQILDNMPVEVNYWKSQNLYFSLLGGHKAMAVPLGQEEKEALRELGRLLGFDQEAIAIP
ncbi:MAG: hypothetical protein ACKOA4_06355, partial [Haliscomenobacter sp.]